MTGIVDFYLNDYRGYAGRAAKSLGITLPHSKTREHALEFQGEAKDLDRVLEETERLYRSDHDGKRYCSVWIL